MKTVADVLREEGEKKGKIEGEKKRVIKDAQKMLVENFFIKLIQKITGLPANEIIELQKKLGLENENKNNSHAKPIKDTESKATLEIARKMLIEKMSVEMIRKITGFQTKAIVGLQKKLNGGK